MIATYYEILGVSPAASSDEIRSAYRARARQVHPDRAGDDQVVAQERAGDMAELNEAFRVLRDPDRRSRYDLSIHEGPLPDWVVTEQPAPSGPMPVIPQFARGFPWLLVAVTTLVMFVLVVVLAGGRSSTPDPVDGVVQVGSCVAVGAQGGVVGETDCKGPYDGKVAAIASFDQDCPSGSLAFRSPSVSSTVCVVPRTP